ncbi:DNA-binding protein WhiA [Corynebacterium liangguodongii]|uniref:Probable cell division protein WhiA n=1 Tax=Corynebacterium liangguodongii TaxID=2079535 RepID=A0A2S0WE57_9CORY|nr:DNA-binding protein WhiA [Corynebacterium liangguodongii]AWB84058.1 DNA-binding protein WhiA [Corynebacterium liangguodongii]PWC00069.1 DNA-binding protein WhiA [Corynebacterium liangguodongii]
MVSLTAQVIDELLQLEHPCHSARVAEAAALVRFAGQIEAGPQGLSLAADFADQRVARRLSASLEELCGVHVVVAPPGQGTGAREAGYVVRVEDDAREVIRRLKLVTASGHPVVGMPSHIISGEMQDVEAAWRGAFLARGTLTAPGRSSSLEVACPCEEAALALVGLARRLSISAKTRQTRAIERVYVRDGDAVAVLLSRMGAQRARLVWDAKRSARQERSAGGQRLATFDDANTRRSAQAAAAAALRVERAMDILGDDVPEHLAEAGSLRVDHRHASLEELGRLADPPMTKDAVAGRIRRLLSLADKRAAELGIPDTHSAVEREGE